jgi:hypothetical protein
MRQTPAAGFATLHTSAFPELSERQVCPLKAALFGLVSTALGVDVGEKIYRSASPLPPDRETFNEVFPAGTTSA